MARVYQDAESESERLERKSGIPRGRGLGASRGMLIGLLLALIVFAAIAVSFWYEVNR